MALTKSDIVAKVHELGFTKKKSVDTIEALLEIIPKFRSKIGIFYLSVVFLHLHTFID